MGCQPGVSPARSIAGGPDGQGRRNGDGRDYQTRAGFQTRMV